jgi:hypothetical protein
LVGSFFIRWKFTTADEAQIAEIKNGLTCPKEIQMKKSNAKVETKKVETKKVDEKKIEKKIEKKNPVKIFVAPRGVDNKIYSESLSTIRLGKKEKKSDDEILALLLTGGINFKDVGKIFNKGLIDLGFIVDPKIVSENLKKEISKREIKFDMTREQLDEIADEISLIVQDAKLSQIMNALRKHFKDNKKKFPQVVREKKGRIGVVNSAMIEVFAKKSNPTEKDLIKAVKKVSDNKMTEENCKSWFKVLWAVKNGKTTEETLKHFTN